MALLEVTELSELSKTGIGSQVMAGQMPWIAHQQVAIGASSAQSQAFSDTTRFIRIHTDVTCRVAFGNNPTASSTSMRMTAGNTEYLGVTPGHKVAVIASS